MGSHNWYADATRTRVIDMLRETSRICSYRDTDCETDRAAFSPSPRERHNNTNADYWRGNLLTQSVNDSLPKPNQMFTGELCWWQDQKFSMECEVLGPRFQAQQLGYPASTNSPITTVFNWLWTTPDWTRSIHDMLMTLMTRQHDSVLTDVASHHI